MKQSLIEQLNLKSLQVTSPPGFMLRGFYLWPNGLNGIQIFFSDFDMMGRVLDHEIMWFCKQKHGDNFLIFYYPDTFVEDKEMFDHFVLLTKQLCAVYLSTPHPGGEIKERIEFIHGNYIDDIDLDENNDDKLFPEDPGSPG